MQKLLFIRHLREIAEPYPQNISQITKKSGAPISAIPQIFGGMRFAVLPLGAAESPPENRLQRLSPSWPG